MNDIKHIFQLKKNSIQNSAMLKIKYLDKLKIELIYFKINFYLVRALNI